MTRLTADQVGAQSHTETSAVKMMSRERRYQGNTPLHDWRTAFEGIAVVLASILVYHYFFTFQPPPRALEGTRTSKLICHILI